MINRQLISPDSVVIVGASEDTRKPGGKVLENLLKGKFKGAVYAVNPKAERVQGIQCYPEVAELPGDVDLAILAIAAPYTLEAVTVLARRKQTRAFIILSAGFAELNAEGADLEREIARIITETGGCLVGPNCIGVMNENYYGVFTLPLPELRPQGVTLVSGSGATAVFIMESGIPRGLPFSAVYSMGNSAQVGVEDMVCWLDENHTAADEQGPLLLYLESIRKPDMLLRHAASLVRKGVPVIALKAGVSDAGSRAASSHTGALAGSDEAAEALFRKAGIIRCYSREEMVTLAAVFMCPRPKGKNFAVVTHAGGPGVMLTDTLSANGLHIPEIKGEKAQQLLEKLYPGASVKNPVDFLATGNASQLEEILNAIETDFDQIDASVVIFGSPGLFPVGDVYDVIHKKIRTSAKPIYPVLPSVVNVRSDIEAFLARGNVFFPDEVTLGSALGKALNTPAPFYISGRSLVPAVEDATGKQSGYLEPEEVHQILEQAGIPVVQERVTDNWEELHALAEAWGYPVVLKATGLLHKSDADAVRLNLTRKEALQQAFTQLQQISPVNKVMIQPMVGGLELFAGVKRSIPFGHLILVGVGGIFIEVLRDYMAGLAPLEEEEARYMIRNLKGYSLIQGIRGQQGVEEESLVRVLCALSSLAEKMPEIVEMDLNPLMAQGDHLVSVDARIRVDKNL